MKTKLFQELRVAIEQQRACAVVTDTDSGDQCLILNNQVSGDLALSEGHTKVVFQRIAEDKSGLIDDTKLFVRVYGPPLRMIVVGAVHIAQALVPMAQLTGFQVTVIDPRDAFLKAGRLEYVDALNDWPDEAMGKAKPDARTAVVTLTHDPKLDDPALAAALKSDAFYIGSLGSTRTHAKRLQRLTDAGFSEIELGRIHGPVGLDIKAKTPTEIAISIMAQVIAARRGAVD